MEALVTGSTGGIGSTDSTIGEVFRTLPLQLSFVFAQKEHIFHSVYNECGFLCSWVFQASACTVEEPVLQVLPTPFPRLSCSLLPNVRGFYARPTFQHSCGMYKTITPLKCTLKKVRYILIIRI